MMWLSIPYLNTILLLILLLTRLEVFPNEINRATNQIIDSSHNGTRHLHHDTTIIPLVSNVTSKRKSSMGRDFESVSKKIKANMLFGNKPHTNRLKNDKVTLGEIWHNTKVGGTFIYQVDVRSNAIVDTSFVPKDVVQHAIQGTIDVNIMHQIPMSLSWNNRWSNSAALEHFSSFSFQFRPQLFSQRLKDKIKQRFSEKAMFNLDTIGLKGQLTQSISELNQLQSWLRQPAVIQKLVEEREMAVYSKEKENMPYLNTDTIRTQVFANTQLYVDSIKGSPERKFNKNQLELSKKRNVIQGIFQKWMVWKKKEKLSTKDFSKVDASLQVSNNQQLGKVPKGKPSWTNLEQSSNKAKSLSALNLDSSTTGETAFIKTYHQKMRRATFLQNHITQLQQEYQHIKQQRMQRLVMEKSAVDAINNNVGLRKKLQEAGISESELPKGYKRLFAVKSFGVGRNAVGFSELTAKDIFVSGLLVEYNPSYYLAFAKGYISSQSNDLLSFSSRNRQQVNICRVGIGQKEGSHLYASYYTGTRNYFSVVSTSLAATAYKIMGYAIEAKLLLNSHTYLLAEFAKSTFPLLQTFETKENQMNGIWKYNDRSNEAYIVELGSSLPSTETKVRTYFKYLGHHFQSYSYYGIGTAQSKWGISVEQPFWKRRFLLQAAIKTNETSNPALANSYNSTAVFTSVQLSFRAPKYPNVAIGYFPSSQLVMLDKNRLSESQFYVLNASISKSYLYARKQMMSMLVFSKYSNQSKDSGLIAARSSQLMFSHSIFFKKYQYQSNSQYNFDGSKGYYTLDNAIQYQINNEWMLGAGIKYNRYTSSSMAQVGCTFSSNFSVPRVGQFQIMVEKGYVPDINHQFVANNSGRISFVKSF